MRASFGVVSLELLNGLLKDYCIAGRENGTENLKTAERKFTKAQGGWRVVRACRQTVRSGEDQGAAVSRNHIGQPPCLSASDVNASA